MSRPLPYGDPAQLGPFQLTARLDETSAGIVYLGSDGDGRQVSVAVLTRGAAGDAAARDRFRAAIHAAMPGHRWGDGLRGWGPPETAPGDPAPVVAAQPEGSAPWVATAYEPERAGAERFLESVLLRGKFWGRWMGRRRGPQFQPYWQGSADPAVPAPPPAAPESTPPERPERGLVTAIMALAVMLAVLAVLLLVLFACQPKVSPPRPPPSDPPSETYQPPQPPPPSLTPSPSPTPTPSGPTTPGRPRSPSPDESGPPDDGGGGPV